MSQVPKEQVDEYARQLAETMRIEQERILREQAEVRAQEKGKGKKFSKNPKHIKRQTYIVNTTYPRLRLFLTAFQVQPTHKSWNQAMSPVPQERLEAYREKLNTEIKNAREKLLKEKAKQQAAAEEIGQPVAKHHPHQTISQVPREKVDAYADKLIKDLKNAREKILREKAEEESRIEKERREERRSDDLSHDVRIKLQGIFRSQ
ncbi:hypothetical protein BKA63DRAFT_607100 [Paraphoma chrysanthemicola]|nr:hypothetical protein BKA63DRAFT_607100 [Paraphoma chrysanthemicola]